MSKKIHVEMLRAIATLWSGSDPEECDGEYLRAQADMLNLMVDTGGAGLDVLYPICLKLAQAAAGGDYGPALTEAVREVEELMEEEGLYDELVAQEAMRNARVALEKTDD